MDDQKKTQPLLIPIAQEAWSASESWLWKQVVAGKVADFHERYGPLFVKHAAGWDLERSIRPSFLETILLCEPYCKQLKRQGVHIRGVWIREEIDLENAVLNHDLLIESSRIEPKVRLSGMKSEHQLSFAESFFLEDIEASSCELGRLKMSDSHVQKISLVSSSIKGDLNLDDARCAGLLNMDGIRIGGCLLMQRIVGMEAKILGAFVTRQVQMEGAVFQQNVDLRGIKVGEDLYAEGNANFENVDLTGARIDGQVSFAGSKFNGELSLNSASIAETVYLSDGASFRDIDVTRARLGQSLSLLGATFAGRLKLTGSTIKDELLIADESKIATWALSSSLILQGATISTVGATFDDRCWPPVLELGDFTYTRWRQMENGETNENVKWLTAHWLKAQKRFSRQPYQQVAKILQGIGYGGLANDVLYACQERERLERARALRKAGLTLLKVTIGYGYGYRFFLSLAWVVVLAVVGAIVFSTVKTIESYTVGQRIVVSVSQLLPIVELDKVLLTKALSELHPGEWQQTFFYGLKLIGYVLGGFVVAGLTGLTKR